VDKARIIVVGAGAAGLLAAGRAAGLIREAGREQEIEVVILERMRQTGRKIRISGKGRCNLSNTLAAGEFIKHFNRSGRFLRQSFARFFTEDLLDLLHGLDLPTIVERGGRIFPASGSAMEVAETLEAWARGQGVRVITGARVRGLDHRAEPPGDRVAGLHYDLFSEHGKTGSGGDRGAHELAATAVLVATGGKSYPATGSTGDGYDLARAAGHTLVATRPSLVPLLADGALRQGVPNLKLRNIEATLWIDGKLRARHFGELHFTRSGLGGPVVLEISRVAVQALDKGKRLELALDLKPALDTKKLDARLIRDLEDGNHAAWGDLIAGLVPKALLPVALQITGVPAEKPCHQVTGPERRVLRDWLKDWRFPITGYGGFDAAIVTAGGVDTRQVDPRTMESRLLPGLYIMGELLDVDADTGGFNLMAAFSTGWVGGEAAARSLLSTWEG
jgi:predicted flavoprotein YhiN